MPQSKKSQKDEHGYTPDNYQQLPNKEAIVHFNGKTLLTAESYLDVKAYEHALAFTVAGLMDEDLLKDVRDAVASAMENGTDFREFKRTLKPYLMAKGWLAETLDDGTQQLVAGSNRRLRTIYSTNLQTAYSAGQWERIQQTKEFLPYLQYMPSVSENPRLSHKRCYGLCRPADDAIWQSIMPPNGWGCFLPDTQIQGDLQSAMLKFYQGVAVKFTTKSGRNLAVTANHPILTERGWVRADSLTTSDNVLCYGSPVNSVGILSGQVNHNQTVATAKNLFKTFFDDAMAVTGTTAFKFNSDVANGEIHIDIFDDGLVLHIRADGLQGIQKVELIRGDNGRFVTIGETDGSSKFAIIVNDFIGFQNSSDITTTAIKAFCQSTLAYFGCSIQLDNFSFQFVITRATDSPSLATLPFNATSRLFDGLPTDNAGTAHISQGDTILKELASNAFTTDFGLFGNLIDTHASLVFADPIVNIRQFSFSGHVYDFQSSESIVSANGIVAHNCKCWVKQLTKRQAQKVGISEKTELDTQEYTNPKTGKTSDVPMGIDPSFNHNFDRLTALFKLAEDKHGTDFSERLAEKAKSIMIDAKEVNGNLISMRTDWKDFPDIFIAHSANTITSHEKYAAAKAGDMEPALELVNDYLDDDFLNELDKFIKKFDDVHVLPVHAEEMAGRNKIPVAYAQAIQQILGLSLDDDIVQATRAFRTQSDGIGRLVKRVSFEGDVVSGRNYLIVDDVVTQGGTLADLKGYIELNGGKVVAASTLSGKANSAKMAITKSTLGQLRKQAGKELEQWWKEQFGYDFSKLTESEARYINKQIYRDGIDAVRDKLIAARLEASS